jgi:FtsH-binding integral membrane protein
MIYVVLMGALLSMFTWMFEPIILIESFGITAGVFGLMALLGYVSKGKLSGIWVVMIGLLIGAGLLAGLNFLMILFGQISETNVALSWIVSLMIFAFLMFMTMWDVARISSIAGRTDNQGKNLIYYCAYILYSDFISILVRVIYYVAIFTRRR